MEESEWTFDDMRNLFNKTAWLCMPIIGGCSMSAPIRNSFWAVCLIALFGRFFFLKFISDYSHLTCTIIGLASVFISYVMVWLGVFDDDISYYSPEEFAPLWMRLIWGLLL